MSENLLKQAQEWRDLVLLVELGGWLHDLGKLSSGFVLSKTDIAYSTAGEAQILLQAEEEEEEEAPASEETEKAEWYHEKVFTYDANHVTPDLRKALRRPLTGPSGWLDRKAILGSDRVGLEALVAEHHCRERDKKKRQEWWDSLTHFQHLLVRADGDDSGEDEYNAVGLFQREPVQVATVFGREKELASGGLEMLDDLRLALYPLLAKVLAEPGAPAAKRGELWKLLRKAMCHGLGKTQRAANDVRLHQHAWGVAARLKAFLLRDLLDRPSKKQDGTYEIRNNFRLLTVRWDAWATITPFARLSDVVGREVMLARLRKTLRRAVEEEYALGNRVYEDDDGVHFLVADLGDRSSDSSRSDQDWGEELKALVREMVNREMGGEVQPVVRLSPPTERVTDLVAHNDAARREVPLVGDPAWVEAWEGSSSGAVCPVCQRRPLVGERDLCKWCERWRGEGIRERLAQEGTVWTGEIAGKAGRVALLVARFDLERWLDGTMLHTLFITSPQDIAQRPEPRKRYPADASWYTLFITSPQDIAQGREAEDASTWDWAHLRSLFPHLDEGRAEVEQREVIERTVQEKKKQQKRLLKERERVQGHRQYIADDDRIPQERQAILLQQDDDRLAEVEEELEAISSDLAGLEPILARPLSPAGTLVGHLQSKPGQEKRVQALTADLRIRYDLAPEDAFLLALARKNPSASRLLRVWQTTQEFLKQQARGLGGMVEEQKRVVFTLQGKPRPGIYEAELPALGPTEVFVRPDGKAQTITRLSDEDARRLRQTRRLRLETGERGRKVTGVEPETYRPFQVITASPNLLLAMLPADTALDVANGMREAYAEEFGKVQGRLPFHVGLVFMDAHYPMFAALDTARRLAETFDRLAEKPIEATLTNLVGARPPRLYALTLHSDRFGSCTWHVPARRGDGETDWYHPYFLVREGEGLEERGMSLVGPAGRWVHVSQLRAGDRLALWPNLFDFLFLDTVSRRFEAQCPPTLPPNPGGEGQPTPRVGGGAGGGGGPASDRRPHPLLGRHRSPRPYLLDGVARLQEIWKAIRAVPEMSETRLEAATSLLAQKWKAWQLAGADSPQRSAAWESYHWLVKKVVARDFGGSETIEEAILDGVFFDAVELYRHILKQSL